jgi:hypothetical protein
LARIGKEIIMNLESQRKRIEGNKVLLHLTVAAAIGMTAAPAMSAAAALPMVHQQGNVIYLSGGIGEPEAQVMKRAAGKYSLEVEFLQKENTGHPAYLAGDHVAILDHAGKTVLDTTAEGPFLLAKLPPGRYTISATDHGVAKKRAVDVEAGKHRNMVFEW